MIRSMIGDNGVDIATADLRDYAAAFLKNAGMTVDQIASLKTHLTAA